MGEECLRVVREIQLGKTRRDALKAMALRVDQPDVRMVVNALVQADELGVGIAVILRIQSDQMRSRRFERSVCIHRCYRGIGARIRFSPLSMRAMSKLA